MAVERSGGGDRKEATNEHKIVWREWREMIEMFTDVRRKVGIIRWALASWLV